MIKLNIIPLILQTKIVHFVMALLLILLFSCVEEEYAFVPYAKVDKYISLTNFNHLYIPGNSITFLDEGYSGVIVICINDQQYYAFDACCPHEGLRTSIIETNPGQAGILIPSSNPQATCKVCGSQYILFNGGYPVKGPSVRSLKQYQVAVVGNRLWVHN